jgi:cyclopropane fatty-acyl-phospholipid synthase-like methyltransferase
MTDRAPYDLVAEPWARAREASEFREKPYVDRFLELLSTGAEVRDADGVSAHILDLGCGSGVPIARYLLDQGCRITGVDSSQELLRRAAANCPEAELLAGDMTSITLSRHYDGIVAWDSTFHVPRSQHQELFNTLYDWLRPGAPVLLSMGASEGEFTAPMFDVDFFYSGHSPAVGCRLLRESGFEIVLAEIDDPSSRGHLAVLCRKTARTVG